MQTHVPLLLAQSFTASSLANYFDGMAVERAMIAVNSSIE
jgi:hypothetical protein